MNFLFVALGGAVYCRNHKWQGWSIQKYGFVLEDRRMRWLYHVFYIFTGSL